MVVRSIGHGSPCQWVNGVSGYDLIKLEMKGITGGFVTEAIAGALMFICGTVKAIKER